MEETKKKLVLKKSPVLRSLCGKNFSSKDHVRRHDKDCKQCKFLNKQNGVNEKILSAPCGLTYRSDVYLKKHMQACKECCPALLLASLNLSPQQNNNNIYNYNISNNNNIYVEKLVVSQFDTQIVLDKDSDKTIIQKLANTIGNNEEIYKVAVTEIFVNHPNYQNVCVNKKNEMFVHTNNSLCHKSDAYVCDRIYSRINTLLYSFSKKYDIYVDPEKLKHHRDQYGYLFQNLDNDQMDNIITAMKQPIIDNMEKIEPIFRRNFHNYDSINNAVQ